MNSVDKTNYVKLCEALFQDFKNLISETRRKYPSIKEGGENVQKLLKELINKKENIQQELLLKSATIVQPLLQGCNTQLQKPVSISLTALQRLATNEVLTEEASAALIGVLWGLMEASIEEVKLLQTIILLITTNNLVQGQNLARGLGLCFRLHESKNSATVSTAAAALRQVISTILDRMMQENSKNIGSRNNLKLGMNQGDTDNEEIDYDALRSNPRQAPPAITGFARDVFMLFQDLCLLINKEDTIWLQGLNGVMQTLGLELLELILVDYSHVFISSKEFTFLLKEKVCPLIIKLFSPNLKFKPNLMSNINSHSNSNSMSSGSSIIGSNNTEKQNFPLICRLIRLITVIIKNYFYLLNTECEIFMSLLIRFLDSEKSNWQRALALEVLYKCTCDPHLIKHICENYDMKEHSTKILKDVISAINSFIQSSFFNPVQSNTSQSTIKDSNVASGPNYVPVFLYKGHAIPIHMNFKIIFYDMLDKPEPSMPPDGYTLSLAFHSLLEIVKSVQAIIEDVDVKNLAMSAGPDGNKQLVEACWGGILSSFTILLDTSNDETATEATLRAIRSMVSLCGSIKFTTARDAFVTTICRASLPSCLAMSVVSSSENDGTNHQHDSKNQTATELNQYNLSHHIITPSSPTSSSSLSTGISDKNIQCVRSLLNVAHCHGALLGTSWNVVLLTLQHMVGLLGLSVSSMGSIVITGKPLGAANGPNNSTSTGGSSSNQGAASNAHGSSGSNQIGSSTGGNAGGNNQQIAPGSTSNLSPAVVADLPVLSAMLSRLFECSQMMDETALNDLVDALCKLSNETVESKDKVHKDPSLFPVAKLMETGLANIKRPEIWWKPVLLSLLEAASHNEANLRRLAADAVIALVKEAICIEAEMPFWTNKKLYDLVLEPLAKLSQVKFGDVRQKQLDCVQYILHHNGDQIGESWRLIIEIIGSIQFALNEQLVRHAFQCFQLVSTDYLTVLGCECYDIIVSVAASFAKQDQDLNISLSAIGSVWYILDFFYQQAESLRQLQSDNNSDDCDHLWIQIFSSLADICIDNRPAVRKSAGQTLFNTIDLHGGVLQQKTWSVLLWKVLFPLLDQVRELCASAPQKRSDNSSNLLMHHSRDTAAKQWSETQVLTLLGVANTFLNKQSELLSLEGNDFPRAWSCLLEYVENAALSLGNQEIAENGLRALKIMLNVKVESVVIKDSVQLRWQQWQSWVKIGQQATDANKESTGSLGDIFKNKPHELPTPKFLTILLELFPSLFFKVKSDFSSSDLSDFTRVLRHTLYVHLLHHTVTSTSSNSCGMIAIMNPSLSVSTDHGYLTPLQKMCIDCLEALSENILDQSSKLNSLLGMLFTTAISLANYCVQLPHEMHKVCKMEQIPGSFISFGENCMELVITMYKKCADNPLLLNNCVLDQIISMLYLPLSVKYNAPSQSSWLLASQCLMTVMKIGIPIAKIHVKESEKMWEILSKTLEDFLFSSQPCPSGLSVEDFQKNQDLDCRFIQLIKTQILSDSAGVPDTFIEELINLLNAGTIDTSSANHYTEYYSDLDNLRSYREEFARLCFETLLQYSYLSTPDNKSMINGNQGTAGTVSRAAVKATLDKCHSVLNQYVEDEKLSGKCPLPRSRLLEVKFVFKALSTLLTAFENTPKNRVEQSTWDQIIQIYPLVVDCVSVTGAHFLKSLRELLHKYQYLLNPK